MPTVAFRVDTTARGKRLLDLGELMREAGYLEGFSFDHDAKEVRFHFAKTPVVLRSTSALCAVRSRWVLPAVPRSCSSTVSILEAEPACTTAFL